MHPAPPITARRNVAEPGKYTVSDRRQRRGWCRATTVTTPNVLGARVNRFGLAGKQDVTPLCAGMFGEAASG